MAQKAKITAATVAALPTGGEIWDTEQRGFFARRLKGGVSFYAKADDRTGAVVQTVTRKLDADTPAQARKQAEQLLPLIRSGQLRRQEQAADTAAQEAEQARRQEQARQEAERRAYRAATARWRLEKVLADYLDFSDLRDSTRAQYGRFMRDYFSDWLSVPVTELEREQLRDRYKELQKRGQATASLGFRYLFALLRFAKSEGADLLELQFILPRGWNKRRTRQATLTPDHIAPLWAIFDKFDPARGDLFKFLLLTGFRFSEAATLQWRHVDLIGRTIRQDQTKTTGDGDLPHVIPIPDHLLTLLQARKDAGDPGKYVFRNARARSGMFESGKISSTTKKIRDALGVDFSPHQLRKLVSNVVFGQLTIPAKHAEWILNRAGEGVDAKHYWQRSDPRELAPSMQQLENFIVTRAGL